MKSFSERTVPGRLVEVLRWLCVLPAAVLGHVAAQFVVDAVLQVARYAGWDIFGGSSIANSLIRLMWHLPPNAAFVIAGAKMAPRHQKTTAIVLTLIGLVFSLMNHVISQHYFAGRRLGFNNYMDLCAESAGALGGAAYIMLQVRKNRRIEMKAR
jgi:VanZ family protein